MIREEEEEEVEVRRVWLGLVLNFNPDNDVAVRRGMR
jgi:hypothetical protein